MKSNLKLAILFFVSIGIVSETAIGCLIIYNFHLTHNSWYLVDIGIKFLNLIGFFIVIVALMKKKINVNRLVSLFRILVISGFLGVSVLTILYLYFHIMMPHLPGKYSIIFLSIDGIFIKIIYDQRIKENIN